MGRACRGRALPRQALSFGGSTGMAVSGWLAVIHRADDESVKIIAIRQKVGALFNHDQRRVGRCGRTVFMTKTKERLTVETERHCATCRCRSDHSCAFSRARVNRHPNEALQVFEFVQTNEMGLRHPFGTNAPRFVSGIAPIDCEVRSIASRSKFVANNFRHKRNAGLIAGSVGISHINHGKDAKSSHSNPFA